MGQELNLFTGIKVVDIATFIAAPAAATILSDFGANVIKIEPPSTGDPYRTFYCMPPNPTANEDYAWQLTNRNKRSLALDLKNPQSPEIIARLVRWADVLITNFPPRVRKALKITYEDLGLLNPRLIYADITSYGDEGPEADKPGFDITAYWARSGLMHTTRNTGGPPAVPIPGIGDHAVATTLYSAIVTGLYQRERTGKGCHVTTSLIAVGTWAAATWVQAALNGAQFFGLYDRKNPPNALVNTYQTSDNRWLLLVLAQQDRDWPLLVQAMGCPELLNDARFTDVHNRRKNTVKLVAILDEVFARKPLDHWQAILDQSHVVFDVVQTLAEVAKDPQLMANQILVSLEGSSKPTSLTVDSPIYVHEVKKKQPQHAPDLGENNVEVLKEMGNDDHDINKLRASGAITH